MTFCEDKSSILSFVLKTVIVVFLVAFDPFHGDGTPFNNSFNERAILIPDVSFQDRFWDNISTCKWIDRTWNVDGRGIYPLSSTQFQHSFTPGARKTWSRVVEHLEKGNDVNIVVIGGSMTTGSGCGPRSSDGTYLSCAWSTYVSSWLTRQYPSWKITLTNIAIGGMSAGNWYSWPKIKSSDIYIIDTTVNAQVYCNARQSDDGLSQITADMANLLTRLLSSGSESTGVAPAILMVQTFRTCSDEKSDCLGHCLKEELKSLLGKDYFWCECWWRMGDFEATAARSLDVPIASYRDAVWPDIDHPPIDLPLFWNGLSHPDQVAHELVSDVVKYALEQLLVPSPSLKEDFMRPVFEFHIENETNIHSSDCESRSALGFPETTLGVHNVEIFTSSAIMPGRAWRFFEDRPLKPGWIGSWTNFGFSNVSQFESDNTSLTLSFNLFFSKNPRLEITFLRSYEGLADVQISIEGCNERIDSEDGRLSVLWDQHYSLPFSTVWVSDSTEISTDTQSHSFRLFDKQCALAGGSRTLSFILLYPGKFKLLSISSC